VTLTFGTQCPLTFHLQVVLRVKNWFGGNWIVYKDFFIKRLQNAFFMTGSRIMFESKTPKKIYGGGAVGSTYGFFLKILTTDIF
jgi:hypothetical protein